MAQSVEPQTFAPPVVGSSPARLAPVIVQTKHRRPVLLQSAAQLEGASMPDVTWHRQEERGLSPSHGFDEPRERMNPERRSKLEEALVNLRTPSA